MQDDTDLGTNLDFDAGLTLDFQLDKDINKAPTIIHIRVKQRNGRKCMTTVEGLESLIDDKTEKFITKLAQIFRKKFNCSATVMKPELVIQLQGDHRKEIKSYLVDNKLTKEGKIKIHGY